MSLKQLPIGIFDFKSVIDGDFYYVDKSLLIKDIIDDGTLVSLITRPRRFGKTLNFSMLQYFFEKPLDGSDNSYLFKNLAIWKAGEHFQNQQGQFPVVFLTFKDIKENNWENCYKSLKFQIQKEFTRHSYLLNSELFAAHEKEKYHSIMIDKADSVSFSYSLEILSAFLFRFYQKSVVLLIDEYDVPIQAGYANNYYLEVVNFLRTFLGAAYKDNRTIYKGLMTGILRVAKESIFSGLNNFGVYSILESKRSSRFGFTEDEVKALLNYYGLNSNLVEVQSWYNGHMFGNTTIYNPWSLLSFANDPNRVCMPYWVNTSSNDLVKELLAKGNESIKQDLEVLMAGHSLSKEIRTDFVFSEIEKSSIALWSFLLFCGYLKIGNRRQIEESLYCDLAIPNREVRYLYKTIILEWLGLGLSTNKLQELLKSLLNGEVVLFGKILQEFVLNSMSFMDPSGNEPEKVYHAFVLGLLVSLNASHEVKSNRESGYGRYDVMLIPKDLNLKGIIIEFKKVDHEDGENFDETIRLALAQIEEKNYAAELMERGVRDILKMAIAFDGKKLKVGM